MCAGWAARFVLKIRIQVVAPVVWISRSIYFYHQEMLSRRALQVVGSLSKNGHFSTRNFSHHRSVGNLRLKHAKQAFLLNSTCCSCAGSRLQYNSVRHSTNLVKSPYKDVVVPDLLLHELIWQKYQQWPDKIAIECGITGRRYTFAQLREHCSNFATALLKSGIKPGQTVAIILPNTPDYPIAVLGAIEAGLIVSTVNPAYTADEISYQFENSKAVYAITFHGKLETVVAAKAKLEEKTKGAQRVNIISIQDFLGIQQPTPPGVWNFREMVESKLDSTGLESVCRDNNITPKNIVVLPYSSGTTGLPKGVCLTHYNIVANLSQIEAKECEHILEPTASGKYQDVLPAVLPFFHIYGFVIIMMSSLKHGGKLVTLPKFDPESYLKVLKEQETSLLYVVPPLIIFLGQHPGCNREMFQYLRISMSAAAPLGESDVERFMKFFPKDVSFTQAYGLTETSPVALIPRNNNKNLSTVGFPCPLTEIKVLDPNTGKAVGPNERGEICIYGPQVMEGYLNNPKATEETIHDGWLHSGDIGYYDESGLFYIVDRLKELIKVKGFQVAPAELEELLRCHEKVTDAAVIGVPDARAGEVPVAYVVRKGDISEEELKSYIAGKVSSHKHLSNVIFTEAIPKSPAGKILRRFLKDSHLKAQGQ